MEKERALAEETQATLAALDAMRKAHEAEVQREIARFKEEFLKQMAARQAPAERELTPNREQEMEEIRRQILSLSEKYSHNMKYSLVYSFGWNYDALRMSTVLHRLQ